MGIRTAAGLAGIIASLLPAVAAWAQPASAPAQPTTAPAATEFLDPQIDKILSRLEHRQVHDLHAGVTWKLRFLTDLPEDALVKRGELWYQQGQPGKFLAHFKQKVSNKRLYILDERYLFDGMWYVELKSEPSKTFVRRQIRRESDAGDPYRLGEGPFPLPFGQKKEDILREFEISLVPPAEGDPENTDHLHLTPRADSQTVQDYNAVDIWIVQEGPHAGLPVKVHTGKKDGTGKANSVLTIDFKDVELNRGFSGSVFELKPPPGYDVHEERLAPLPAEAAAEKAAP